MSKEEAELELREAQKDAPSPAAHAAAAAHAPPDTDATEADVSEADLDRDPEQQQREEDEEKVPMTAGGQRDTGDTADATEPNGAVKLKIPDEEPELEHFTGLNKEQLLRVAGTPGWVRTRWALLVLFWFSWLGMLAGAVLLILKAPPCKEPPALHWWNQGPLLHIQNLRDFSPSGDLRGVEQQLDSVVQMKVGGLVLGPVHADPKDDAMNLSFEEVSAEAGSLDQIKSLIQHTHARGLMLVLDLTPNPFGSSGPWFSNNSVSSVTERLKSALVFWLGLGVDGFRLDSVELLWSLVPSQWNDVRSIVQNWTDARAHRRLLLGSSSLSSPSEVSVLLGDTGVDLLSSQVLSSQSGVTELAQSVLLLSSAHSPAHLLWSMGPAGGAVLPCDPLDLMLLMTLPGTALIQDRDQDRDRQGEKFPKFQDLNPDQNQDQNRTQQDPTPPPSLCVLLLSSLSSLRLKERSLLHGGFTLVYNSTSVLVYLRSWDQSPRFLVLFNYSPDQVFSLSQVWPVGGGAAGTSGRVVLTSNATVQSPDSDQNLSQVTVGPRQSVILKIQQG